MPCLALEISTTPFFVHLAKMGLWGAGLALSCEDVFGLVQGSGVFCLTAGLGFQLGFGDSRKAVNFGYSHCPLTC